MGERTKWLVSTQWLEDHLDSPDVVVIDGSWYLPDMERDAIAEYREAHIPGAIFFDIDAIADLTTDLPHMLPTPSDFSSMMSSMGIHDGQKIVVYDGMGLFTAPRLWWTFRTMGVDDVAILDGGLPKWKNEDRVLSDMPPVPRPGSFTSRFDHGAVRNYQDILKALDDDAVQIIDARPQERWAGLAAEPRPNVRSGRMPGSKNLPFYDLVDETGCLKGVTELRNCFERAGVDLNKAAITSCGSGVTAAVITLALDTVGHQKHALYDGSWSEWGARDDTPVVKDTD